MTTNRFTLVSLVLLIVAVATNAPLRAQKKVPERGDSRRDRAGRESKGRDSDRRADGERRRGERGRAGREHGGRELGGREHGGREHGDREHGSRGRGRSRGDRHERWKGFDAEKKRKIEELHRRIGKLPKDQRESLLKRLREMSTEERREAARRAKADSKRSPVDRDTTRVRDDMLRHVWRGLTPDKRAELEAMESEERHEHIKNMYRKRRENAMKSLPEALRKEIGQLSGEEQVFRLRRYLAEKRAGQVFDKAELEKIRSLSHRELSRLLRPSTRRRHPREGGPNKSGRPSDGTGAERSARPRPEFISEASWKRWNELPRYERPRLLMYVRGDMKPMNRPPHPGARRGPPPRGPRRGFGPRDGVSPGSDRDRARQRSERRPSSDGPRGAGEPRKPKPKERQRPASSDSGTGDS